MTPTPEELNCRRPEYALDIVAAAVLRGYAFAEIARELGCSTNAIRLWRTPGRRFVSRRIARRVAALKQRLDAVPEKKGASA